MVNGSPRLRAGPLRRDALGLRRAGAYDHAIVAWRHGRRPPRRLALRTMHLFIPPTAPPWLVYLHIAGGLVGILAGAVAVTARKGSPVHRAAGKAFTAGMAVPSGSGRPPPALAPAAA